MSVQCHDVVITSHGRNFNEEWGSIFAGRCLQKQHEKQAMEGRMGVMTHECKMQGIERENSPGITVWARTDSGDCCPEDAAEQNARMSVLHENEGQNSGAKRSCTESGDAKT
jgi:hypothetical protein